ncbi:MAG: Undecaprenyl-diphosphatase [Candidatus Roizmanbacteria bacterium GW2011_GWA2_35_19]|uniref:Undecaprenyl-diphosphatase n=1 Tax=Candidatus Roizmanbacteria bacterium GW2011_GWA2_35_19 TaxID=1618478 RepID=A0A0G0EYM2_9BACT|nr:MAG: Undecaprenyl-diphosphatase [Candidatus Roizmanbacteria bacterium GW2011_GWA2_35_19]
MNIIHSFVLGVVEGVTEFLPISSTAHLIITSKLLGITQTEFIKFFEVFIQSGAILAVIFIYFSYVVKHKDLWLKIAISFIPTAIVGLILEKTITKYFFNSLRLIEVAMFGVGILFIVFEWMIKKGKIRLSKSIQEMNHWEAFLIGVGQSLAVVPGVSRAGIVMLTMMGQGFKRSESAIYSFILAIPTIFAASTLDFFKTDFKLLTNNSNLQFLLIGFFTSFVFAYIFVKWLIGYLKKYTLVTFGLYRIILTIILLLFLR